MRHLSPQRAVAAPITAHCQPTVHRQLRQCLPQKPYRRILPPQAAVRLRIPRQTLLIKQAPTSRTVRHLTVQTSKTVRHLTVQTSKTVRHLTVQTSKTVHRLTVQTSKTTRPMLLLKRQSLRQTSRKAVLLPLHQASLQTAQALQQASLRLQLSPIPPKSPPQQPLQKSLPQQLPQQLQQP